MSFFLRNTLKCKQCLKNVEIEITHHKSETSSFLPSSNIKWLIPCDNESKDCKLYQQIVSQIAKLSLKKPE